MVFRLYIQSTYKVWYPELFAGFTNSIQSTYYIMDRLQNQNKHWRFLDRPSWGNAGIGRTCRSSINGSRTVAPKDIHLAVQRGKTVTISRGWGHSTNAAREVSPCHGWWIELQEVTELDVSWQNAHRQVTHSARGVDHNSYRMHSLGINVETFD